MHRINPWTNLPNIYWWLSYYVSLRLFFFLPNRIFVLCENSKAFAPFCHRLCDPFFCLSDWKLTSFFCLGELKFGHCKKLYTEVSQSQPFRRNEHKHWTMRRFEFLIMPFTVTIFFLYLFSFWKKLFIFLSNLRFSDVKCGLAFLGFIFPN